LYDASKQNLPSIDDGRFGNKTDNLASGALFIFTDWRFFPIIKAINPNVSISLNDPF